jgi:hypothetical protein
MDRTRHQSVRAAALLTSRARSSVRVGPRDACHFSSGRHRRRALPRSGLSATHALTAHGRAAGALPQATVRAPAKHAPDPCPAASCLPPPHAALTTERC